MKTNTFFVVSNWNNDIDWITDYTKNYVIYDKSNTLDNGDRIIKMENCGYNIRDYCHFIYENYDNLPDVLALMEGNPWDHCNRVKFDRLIKNNFFTPVESYENVQQNNVVQFCSDGGYTEINNSWYITSHNSTHNITCKYSSYDELMNKLFKNYVRPNMIRFSPGAQYIVEKERLRYYPKSFWKFIMDDLYIKGMCTEAHIYERALWTILSCCFEPNEEL